MQIGYFLHWLAFFLWWHWQRSRIFTAQAAIQPVSFDYAPVLQIHQQNRPQLNKSQYQQQLEFEQSDSFARQTQAAWSPIDASSACHRAASFEFQPGGYSALKALSPHQARLKANDRSDHEHCTFDHFLSIEWLKACPLV